MKYYSTKNKTHFVSFRQAVLQGMPADGGLYMPERIPRLSGNFIRSLNKLSFAELAVQIASRFIDDLSPGRLEAICQKVFTFDTPLVELESALSVLELFHGPTLAFKDFGARFLAALLREYTKNSHKKTVVLVATSGDTGSAVAHGFLGMEGVTVALLYPSGMVSKIQEQQLTTIGGNVHAFEIQGTFDSCQRLVKTAFRDADLKRRFNLSPANSINIARLLPQSLYYFRAYAQLKDREEKLNFVVPSGNFGNLTAGLLAASMGLPAHRFIAAVNANRFFPDFLHKGKAQPRPAVPTLSNAMDVGDPSNFARILDLYGNDRRRIRSVILSRSISDEETLDAIREGYDKYGYIFDPHAAVGYTAWKALKDELNGGTTVLLETAHPAKFRDSVEQALKRPIDLPDRLAVCLNKPKQAKFLEDDFTVFKEELIRLLG